MKDGKNLPQTPGGRLKALRDERNLSQLALANEIGKLQPDSTCSEKQISMVENGHRSISAKYALLYSEFFGVDVDYILCKTDYRTQAEKYASTLANAQQESNLLFTGLWAFATLNGYDLTSSPLSGNVKEVLETIKKTAYMFEKDGKIIHLSMEEMNDLENEICDMVETRLKYLFKEKRRSNG